MSIEKESISEIEDIIRQEKEPNIDKIKEFLLSLKIEFTKEEDGFEQIISFSEKEINKLHWTDVLSKIFTEYLDKPDLIVQRFKKNVVNFNLKPEEWKQAVL